MLTEEHKGVILNTLKPGKNIITKHLGCTDQICKTIQVDFDTHLVWFTTIVNKVSVTRQSMSYKEFIDVVDFVTDSVVHDKVELEQAS